MVKLIIPQSYLKVRNTVLFCNLVLLKRDFLCLKQHKQKKYKKRENIYFEVNMKYQFNTPLLLTSCFLFILLFYLFAFSWNPKTLISGDIATNSLYKIIYNSSKIIFGFSGFRILQDNPIIQFHKKFIE